MDESSTIQFLTFRLAEETYGVEVTSVLEVQADLAITRVPRTPAFMLGVVNLRGSVVPVVDMRRKLGMSVSETEGGSIVVFEVSAEGEQSVIGGRVDGVEAVVELAPDQIEPPPKVGMQVASELIRGMGKAGDHFVILLDVDRVFSPEEMAFSVEQREEPTEE